MRRGAQNRASAHFDAMNHQLADSAFASVVSPLYDTACVTGHVGMEHGQYYDAHKPRHVALYFPVIMFIPPLADEYPLSLSIDYIR